MATVGPPMYLLPTTAGLRSFSRRLGCCFLSLWGLRSRFDELVRLEGKAVGRRGGF